MERFISKQEKYVHSLPAVPAAVTQADLENWGLNDVILRHYQLEGLNWLARRYGPSRGCIIGDEMGLGKTLQSISLILYVLKGRKLTGPILVVCPLSVMNNWQEELLRCTIMHLSMLCTTGTYYTQACKNTSSLNLWTRRKFCVS